ncbi:MAG: mechanosensitive ion channel family protein [Deltaproteobacteria bacterium]|nr:mechanosensitive ion channel family protein [Deltaproteobacteria bacterium]
MAMDFEKMAALIFEKIGGWLTVAVKMLPNLVVMVFVLIFFWIISLVLAQVALNSTRRISKQEHLARLMGRLAKWAVIAVGVVLALDVLHLDKAVASLLAGIGILGVAIGFASKDIAANFMAGMLLTLIPPFRVGDLIKSQNFTGYVEEIALRATIGRNLEGDRVFLPNKDVLGNEIINYTILGGRRVVLDVSVAYNNDLNTVESAAVEAIKSLKSRKKEKPVEFFLKEFGSNTIKFTIRFWTDAEQQKDILQAQSDAIRALKQTFDEREIVVNP